MTVDVEDLLALPVFIAGNLAQLDLYAADLGLIDLGAPFHTVSAGGYTTELSLGLVVALAALGWVLYTNDVGFSGWSAMQSWLIITVVWLTISPPFVPFMGALLGMEVAATAAIAVQSIGYIALLYIG
ncbi:hypothetical protein HLRTI_001519 [Halorhabdus tiamatea SARL4B]|uniref:Uncharacterized protein n=2 Tax=Halorhabdus tiamatea SARL4B TaxID=1033806 RepID=U2F8K3_9EURY|nr:hypothetical protein HLRTI_001519 [Halorhabdus tiamatea SARL4B]